MIDILLYTIGVIGSAIAMFLSQFTINIIQLVFTEKNRKYPLGESRIDYYNKYCIGYY